MTTFIGKPLPRKEDARHLLGAARFIADIQPAHTLHVAFVRSPHSHARILGIDVPERLAVAVLTPAEVRERTEPFTHKLEIPGIQPLAWFALAQDVARYVGEPVLALAASSRYAAEDALDTIQVDYQPFKAVPDVTRALAPGAPRLYDAWPDNRLLSRSFRAGDVDGIFARAALVVERGFESQRCSGFPLETRGCLAEFNAGTGQLSVWSSTQWPHPLRTVLAELLRLPESHVRVTAPDVGGGFGNKQHMFSEEVAVCLLAIKTGRPVKWIEDRRENLSASVHAGQQELSAAAAVDRDGIIQALRLKVVADLGAASLYFTGVAPQLVTVAALPGPYRVQNYAYELECVVTNKCPVGAYRGFGRPQATFAMERLLDQVAVELRLDPAEVRRRNLLQPDELPYETVTGGVLDSGRYHEALDLALTTADYDYWRAQQAKARKQQRYLGIGLACFVEATAPSVRYSAGSWAGYDAATARLEPDGQLAVYVGISSHGQGLETSLAQVAADALGVSPDNVSIFHGDTSTCPYGLGTFGSRSAIVGGVSVARAVGQLRGKITRLAAAMLEANSADLQIVDGQVRVAGAPGRSLSLLQVAQAAYHPARDMPGGEEPGLQVTSWYQPAGINDPPDADGRLNNSITYSNAVHLAVVEVDPDTGGVQVLRYVVAHDCGTVINPLIVEGQIQGGVAQGLGSALYEDLIYDEGGQFQSGSFMDYLMPMATEVPHVTTAHLATPAPNVEGGFKGMGEGGLIGAPAALANAVTDALAPLGIAIDRTPISPDALFVMLNAVKHP